MSFYKEKSPLNVSQILEILLGEFRERLDRIKGMVMRDAEFPDAPNKIKVAIGMRRAGKTYFLYQQILKMLGEGVSQTSILYINFEDDRLLPLNEQKLAQLVDGFYSLYPENHDRKCYLFFDEIQNIDNWPIVIRRLHDTKNAEIFLTGSSAKLLSKEIASSLRGRSLAIEIWPYSFNEFMRARNIQIDRRLYDKTTQDKLKQTFLQYLSGGGFPETVLVDQDTRQQILQEYLNVAIYRDIIERYDVKHPLLIKNMISSMIHNVGKPFAVNKFYNDSKTQGYQVGKDILYEYADYIEDAYLSFLVCAYDKSHRKMQNKSKKLYAIDPGMVRALTLDYESNFGRLFENIVYLELRRLGYQVSYYETVEGYEVDFLVQTPRGDKKLFQVVWDMQDPSTLAREERALSTAMKELKTDGVLISLDSYLRDGIPPIK